MNLLLITFVSCLKIRTAENSAAGNSKNMVASSIAGEPDQPADAMFRDDFAERMDGNMKRFKAALIPPWQDILGLLYAPPYRPPALSDKLSVEMDDPHIPDIEASIKELIQRSNEHQEMLRL